MRLQDIGYATLALALLWRPRAAAPATTHRP